MPGKRARRHFSQLREIGRGLIIGMKTTGWLTRRVAGEVDRSECAVRNCREQWTREGTHARKTGSEATRKTTRREDRRIGRQALVDPTVTRSTWCQARSRWNVTDWQKVVFSDESRFVLGADDKRVRVWRRSGERYNSSHTVLRPTARTAGPFLNGLPGAIFQQDNARPHTARVAEDFLRHFQTLAWPARSTDLSPVEHVWDQLKRQMPSCHSVHDLELAVRDLWAHLPQNNTRFLINSMPDRVVACIATGGGPTRF
ncbi:transposable element Tcb1 transposase [Trichonephila clavipes]|nr:transposable element Tcb1 transposase [Trichonephila clavipes]